MIYVTLNAATLNMDTWRAVSAFLRVVMGLVRVLYMVPTGHLRLDSQEALLQLLLFVISSLLGLGLGNLGARHLTPSHFQLAGETSHC